MKFNLGDLVWYLHNNTVHSSYVLARVFFDYTYKSELPPALSVLAAYKNETYLTSHGMFGGERIYRSKKELVESL